MHTSTWVQSNVRGILFTCICAIQLPSAAVSLAQDQPLTNATTPPPQLLTLAQARQCERRAGPFVTQDTAWQRWRQARDQGRAVSRGVVPCYDQHGTRGYCFFIFYAC